MCLLQPRYIPGTVGCAVCFGLQVLVIILWRVTLVLRNKRRDRTMLTDGLSPEERARRAKEMGEDDMTDFSNPYVSFVPLYLSSYLDER